MSTCNRSDLQTLGSQPVMPKNLPDQCNVTPLNIFGCCDVATLWSSHEAMAQESAVL